MHATDHLPIRTRKVPTRGILFVINGTGKGGTLKSHHILYSEFFIGHDAERVN